MRMNENTKALARRFRQGAPEERSGITIADIVTTRGVDLNTLSARDITNAGLRCYSDSTTYHVPFNDDGENLSDESGVTIDWTTFKPAATEVYATTRPGRYELVAGYAVGSWEETPEGPAGSALFIVHARDQFRWFEYPVMVRQQAEKEAVEWHEEETRLATATFNKAQQDLAEWKAARS